MLAERATQRITGGPMQRNAVIIAVCATLVAATGGAAPRVLGPDDRPLEHASVVADADAYWVRDGASRPLLIRPDAANELRIPEMPVARLVVLDAATGKPLPRGTLRWVDPDLPDELAAAAWTSADGRLDLGCAGGETVILAADGYREQRIETRPGDRRRTVLLEPVGDLTIVLNPPVEARLQLAAVPAITVVSPFADVARTIEIAADGRAVADDLDAGVEYLGVITADGLAPVVGRVSEVPKTLRLRLDDGLGLTGRVLDRNAQPVMKARITATGRIEELGGYRYRQRARTDDEGRFAVHGLRAGEIELRACAPDFACAAKTVDLTGDAAATAVELTLEPGHDLRLEIRDVYDRPAAGAAVFDSDRYKRYRTDERGSLVLQGISSGDDLQLEISGAGLLPWRGRVDTGRREIVLRLPIGGVIEWPIVATRIFDDHEVVATWSRVDDRGREVATGTAVWDAQRQRVRADGLDAGRHRLSVRLPGSATLYSEIIELAVGEELALPAAIPDRGMAVGGRVLDGATLQPVAGARITCEPGSPHEFRKPRRLQHLQHTLSDADGIFLLEGLDPGRCRAVIRAPGFAPWRRDGVLPDDVGYDLGDIELDHGVTIVGQVVDRAERPQIGVTVEITEDAAYAYFAEAAVRTDHDGWFRVDSLPAGRWAVTARRGAAEARSVVEGMGGETLSTRLRLGGIRLEGEIWIGDRPAVGGSLVLSTDDARGDGIVVMIRTGVDDRRLFGVERPPMTIAVSGDGRFAADGVTPGVYTASYTAPGAGGSPVNQELVIPETVLHRCLIRYSDAGLDGVVVDPDGLPVAGAAVFVLGDGGHALANGFTDGDGLFAFTGLDEGMVRVTALHTEFGQAEATHVELRSGDRAGPLTIELAPPDGAELTVRVVAASGSLGGAPVYLVGAETMTGFTDDLGIASFSGVEPGRHRPCAAAFGGAVGCGPDVSLDRGDRREVALELGSGGFVDVLLGPMERSPALRVLTADGIDITSMLMMVSPPIPGPDGVRIGPLKADDYRITVAMAAGPRQGTVTAVDGEDAVLDLR